MQNSETNSANSATAMIESRPDKLTIPAWQLPDLLDAVEAAGGHVISVSAKGVSGWIVRITWPILILLGARASM